MKFLLLIPVFFIATCLSVLAQAEAAPSCPTIKITGPSGVTRPGDTMTFVVDVSQGDTDKYKYNWSVSAGTIEDGRGTAAIMVRSTTSNCQPDYVVTVEIAGLPTGCTNTASETAVVRRGGGHQLLDTYDRLPFSKEKARLRAAAKEVKSADNRKLVLVLVLYRTKGDSLRTLKKRSENISRFLRTIGLGDKGFQIVFAERDRYSTSIYLIPAGCDK